MQNLVLNALRHQRFGTSLVEPKFYRGISTTVLNALRHQRFGTETIMNKETIEI